ncbi:MAG: hypothetical protein CMH54_08950 [Myxococcales bacterium]|nr:hypothetical protein [Myxococcales bacterium]
MTTSTVQILPDDVINRIAAGEVVDRPASVVKELVENSLDAKASNIEVHIGGGGLDEIRVLDNGSGMPPSDASRALLRHATSKIRNDTELQRIQSLGFRGEALPSIASVSDFELLTGQGPDVPGSQVMLESKEVVQREAPPRDGTLVIVRNLFSNVPARRKFLKAPRTEFGHILEVVRRASLARPDVSFLLTHDNRTMLKARCTDDLRARARSVFGSGLSKRMFEVRSTEGVPCFGLLSPPSDATASTKKLHILINGRPIRDPAIIAAVRQAYGPLLERGKTPAGILVFDLDPLTIDVNVHPAKTEIRFSDPSTLYRTVLHTVRSAVGTSPWLSFESNATAHPVAVTSPTNPTELPAPSSTTRSTEPARKALELEHHSGLRYLGQTAKSFLVCDDGTRLVIIDQQAAHERILQLQIRSLHGEGKLEQQALLFPESIRVDSRQYQLVSTVQADLISLGFDVEPAAPGILFVRAVPQLLRRAELADLFPELLNILSQTTDQRASHNEDVYALLARHGCLKRGEIVGAELARELLSGLDSSPSDRSVSVMAVLGYTELDRLFARD